MKAQVIKMKTVYEEPMITIVAFESNDIITESIVNPDPWEGNVEMQFFKAKAKGGRKPAFPHFSTPYIALKCDISCILCDDVIY